jgi:hypothetical protein
LPSTHTVTRRWLLVLFAICAVVSDVYLPAQAQVDDAGFTNNELTPTPPYRSRGLFTTAWPTDHGDTARQKYTVGAGLPAQFDADQVQQLRNDELPYPQWMYTRHTDELYVYGSSPTWQQAPYFAKVDAQTLEVRQRIELPKILYIGGALMHADGDVFLVHGSTLTRFAGGDLSKLTQIRLSLVNGTLTQYNGMLVGDDGRLLLKGWALTRQDVGFFPQIVWVGAAMVLLVGIMSMLVLRKLLGLRPVAAWAGGVTLGFAAPFVVAGAAGFSLWKAMAPGIASHLLVIDPHSLEIVQTLIPPERLPFGRMAMYPDGTGGEWLVVPGDEFVHRWHYDTAGLEPSPAWSERYRTAGDGSFPGTGPSIFDNQVYYTDNTFPVDLGAGYRLYRKELVDSTAQTTVNLSPDKPGYMFFSTVISPVAGAVLVWDTGNANLESRDLKTLALQWSASLVDTDCITVAADRGQVYAVDHSRNLNQAQMMSSVGRRPAWPDIEKSFVVLDAMTGQERLRVPLGSGSPVASMIVPGMNSDVFVATRDALHRIYIPASDAAQFASSGSAARAH